LLFGKDLSYQGWDIAIWDIINLVAHLSQAPGWPAVDYIHTMAITLGMLHATGREFKLFLGICGKMESLQ